MPEKTCPLGHTCNACLWQVRLRGTNPQTGQEVDKEDCAMAVLPLLMVENAQKAQQTAAAVESFRNQVINPPSHRYFPGDPPTPYHYLPSQD